MSKNTDPDFHVCRGNAVAIPEYIYKLYSWAYLHPWSVRFFDRQWVVNFILWGNYKRLRDFALDAVGKRISGRTLQVACVYGDFTPRLVTRLAADAMLDVVDILPIQLHNLSRKLSGVDNIQLYQCNSGTLGFADNAAYDQAVLFFLLHEQPEETRRATLEEVFRVVKPGGKIVIFDYHKPSAWHPLRYLMWFVLRWLEPYALDLWQQELTSWMPDPASVKYLSKDTSFGGLYQHVVIEVE